MNGHHFVARSAKRRGAGGNYFGGGGAVRYFGCGANGELDLGKRNGPVFLQMSRTGRDPCTTSRGVGGGIIRKHLGADSNSSHPSSKPASNPPAKKAQSFWQKVSQSYRPPSNTQTRLMGLPYMPTLTPLAPPVPLVASCLGYPIPSPRWFSSWACTNWSPASP